MDRLIRRFAGRLDERFLRRVGAEEVGAFTARWLLSHPITHEFNHKGQILVVLRLSGVDPGDCDLVNPSDAVRSQPPCEGAACATMERGGSRQPVERHDRDRSALSHILWLGGASDSGKTTVARILAQRHGWQPYHCDQHEHNHFIERADPVLQPAMFGGQRWSIDQSWVHTTPEALFDDVLATNDERFPMICDDLRAMPRTPPVLVEGPRLFPKLVQPLLRDVRQAVWLLPTEAFALRTAARRDKPQGRFRAGDPERYRRNFLGREALLRIHIRREVSARGLSCIEVDGSQPAEAVAAQVEAVFSAYLRGATW